jgi:pimeloyl-ACP methyl ester carboxylesterase
MRQLVSTFLLFVSMTAGLTPAAFASDPAPKSAPASMVPLAVPSHRGQLLGVFYLAAGAGPHPTAIVMHGFPGYEQNLDLAQAIRRAGWNVMAVHYRGSWGVEGGFSFKHAAEDADAEVAFLRDPANAARFHIDTNKIVLIGHSMGGLMVASAAAHDPRVAALVMISAWNISSDLAPFGADQESAAVARFVSSLTKTDLAPLTGCTAESLGSEVFRNRATLNFLAFAPALATRPVLIITSDDGLAADDNALSAALAQAGNKRTRTLHFASDHSYSGQRIQLASAIVDFLSTIQ